MLGLTMFLQGIRGNVEEFGDASMSGDGWTFVCTIVAILIVGTYILESIAED